MYRVSVRVDEDLYHQLSRRAAGANLSVSDFVRSVLKQAALPEAPYIYSSNDEIIGICIQVFAIVGAIAHHQSSEVVENANEDARRLLRQRGLLVSEKGR